MLHDVTGRQAPAWMPFVAGLRGFVRKRVPVDDVDDVTQDVLLRLHRGASGLARASRPEAWVYTVARRAIADYYRSRSHVSSGHGSVDHLAVDPVAEGPDDVHEEVLSWLRPMVDDLPPKYGDALRLTTFGGLTQREFAERSGLSLSGAKSRVQRARDMLGAALSACCEIEFGPEGRAVDFVRRDCDC